MNLDVDESRMLPKFSTRDGCFQPRLNVLEMMASTREALKTKT